MIRTLGNMPTIFPRFKQFRFSRQIITEEANAKFIEFSSNGSYTDTCWQPTYGKIWSKFVFLPTMPSRTELLIDNRDIFTRKFFGAWFSRMFIQRCVCSIQLPRSL